MTKKMNEFSAHEIKIIKNEFAKHSNEEYDPEQLTKTEKFFDRIIKNNNAIKLLVDVKTDKIVNSNKYAQEFYGYSESELHTKEIYEINVLKEDEVKDEYIRSQELGRDYFESKQKNSKGEIKKVMIRSTSLSIKDNDYIYLIIHELPEKDEAKVEDKKKEVSIFSLNSSKDEITLDEGLGMLEQNAKDLVSLSNKLAESEEKLKQLNASKDRFFSIISHDLKNSFFSIMGLSKILADPENTDSKQKKMETAQMLHESSKKLYNFLENLLSWARLQRGEMEFNPTQCNLYEIVAEVIYLFKAKAKQNGVKLSNKVSLSQQVFCDQNMVNTILRNLVSNAINFTQAKGTVIVEAKNNGEEVFISVTDSGIGISEENINKLLQIDKKHIEPNINGEKGTGLGLILCKEFVEKHDGKIWVESQEGEGSKFIFTLPYNLKTK